MANATYMGCDDLLPIGTVISWEGLSDFGRKISSYTGEIEAYKSTILTFKHPDKGDYYMRSLFAYQVRAKRDDSTEFLMEVDPLVKEIEVVA
jgi:hypothetical protein